MSDTKVTWRKDDLGVVEGGQTGGDWQEGDNISIRFLADDEREDGLRAFVEENWYAERVEDPKDSDVILGYQVTCQTEYMICEDLADPGSTEVWCDYEYESLGHIYATVDQARAVARHEAETSDASFIGWDGRSKDII